MVLSWILGTYLSHLVSRAETQNSPKQKSLLKKEKLRRVLILAHARERRRSIYKTPALALLCETLLIFYPEIQLSSLLTARAYSMPEQEPKTPSHFN